MKKNILKKVQLLLTLTLLWLSCSAFSQKANTWKGGTPGMKNEWNCPQNWSESAVPDEFSDVIIPDVSTSSFALPVIRTGKVEINSLRMQHNGSLTIAKDAVLIVFDHFEGVSQANIKGEGIAMHYDDSLQVSFGVFAKGQ